MATITFYEKPGCINGEKQKNILEAAGHKLQCINILSHSWSREELLRYVRGKGVNTIVNYTAPKVKNGEINPEELTFEEAVALMIKDPILIKRPLIQIDSLYIQGFDDDRLKPYLGSWNGKEDVITCPNLMKLSCDEQRGS